MAQDSLSYIIIRDAPDGGGNEVTEISMTADDSLILYATGYDTSDNFIGDQLAKWVTNGSLETIPDDSTDILIFSPRYAPREGTIIAQMDNISDATGTITVSPGSLCEVLFFPEYPDTIFVSVGQTMMLSIIGYDCEDNPIPDIVLDSTDVEIIGTLEVEFNVDSLFHSIFIKFLSTGQGQIILMGTDTSGIIIVQEPDTIAPEYIQIRSAPDGEGKEVQKWLRSDDGYIRLYCAGYDQSGNFIGNIPVFWRISFDYGNLVVSPDISDSLVIEPLVIDLRIDYVRAYHRDLDIEDSTGVLYLVDNSLHNIQIRTAPDGKGDEFSSLIMHGGDEIIFYAASYDSSDNFIQNQRVEWSATGSLDIENTIDTALVFSPKSDPRIGSTMGTIIATIDNLRDTTGLIIVLRGGPCYIKIQCVPHGIPSVNDCFPEYDDTTTVYVGDGLSLYAAAYDRIDNFIGNVELEFIDFEFTETLKMENWAFTDVGKGRIIAKGIDTSGVFIVEEPTSITEDEIIKSGFKLAQAYPNPFNPSTTIQFYLPKSEHVKLDIYNSIGQIVETLIDWQMTAGEHKVEFNAMHLSSGVYYYRLVTTIFKDVKKFILMKKKW